MNLGSQSVSEKLSWKENKPAKYCMVGSLFIEWCRQEWTIHLPVVFINACILQCVKIAEEGKT